MQLPIDIQALVEDAMNIGAADEVNLSVSVYIDSKAPADVVAHIRSTFASSLPTVRLTLSYLDNSFEPHEGDDIALIVAGESRTIGSAAAVLRAAEIPVAVVTTLPATVNRIASEGKHAIPDGDIISPVEFGDAVEDYDISREPIALTDELTTALDERLGRWIIAVCEEKCLSFAVAFPFMRRCLALDSIQATSLQNAAIGLIPFIPGSDLPIMTANQAKMVLQIATAYGQPLDKDRLIELAAVVGSAYVWRTIARTLIEFIPVVGFIVRPGVAFGGTAAVGHAAMGYFEEGRNVSGIVKVASNAAKKAGIRRLRRRMPMRKRPRSFLWRRSGSANTQISTSRWCATLLTNTSRRPSPWCKSIFPLPSRR